MAKEPTEEQIKQYQRETGFGYHTAKAMLMKAAPKSIDQEKKNKKKDTTA